MRYSSLVSRTPDQVHCWRGVIKRTEKTVDPGAGVGQNLFTPCHYNLLSAYHPQSGSHFQGCTLERAVCFGDYSEWYA